MASAAAAAAPAATAKREREPGALALTAASAAAEVAEWLAIMVPAFDGRDAALAACASLDGAALLELTEARMKELGFKAFGIRRKLTLCIREMQQPAAAAQQQQPTGGGGGGGGAVPKGAVAAAAAAAAAADTRADATATVDLDHAAVEAQLNAEASCIGVCQWSAKTLAATIVAAFCAALLDVIVKSPNRISRQIVLQGYGLRALACA